METTLLITEIYASVQGESSYAGIPCTFVRLTGCPLRCRWCDTAYAFQGGKEMSIAQIVAAVEAEGLPLVELTGGEPLAQPNVAHLAKSLAEKGYKVLIETSGSEPIDPVLETCHIIMDIKCPGSRMEERNHWANLEKLKPTDEIKFVIADRADFDWAMDVIRKNQLDKRFHLLLSVAFGLLQPKDLVSWILAEKLACRLNLQQHKYIWSPRAKGV